MPFKILFECLYSLGFSYDLVELYQPRWRLSKTFHLALPNIKLLPDTLETIRRCLSQPKQRANTLLFLDCSQAFTKTICRLILHLLSLLLLPLLLRILGMQVRMGFKEVHDLFGGNLLAEC